MYKGWEGFSGQQWKHSVNVRDFIRKNYSPYSGDESFLTGPTDRTKKVWSEVKALLAKETKKGGTLDMETKIVSTITSYGPGYINEDLELIVGLQTDKPLKRALQPFGGIRMAKGALEEYNYKIDENVEDIFTNYRKTHNQGVFDVYTKEMRDARRAGIITGLPDAYGRGRIIGDYRRVALYGIDFLLEDKKSQLDCGKFTATEDIIRLREELTEQVRALEEIKELGAIYGFDISKPATTAKEAIQWTYFSYLAAVKEQISAAMSIGRISTYLDIYIERDIQKGILTEEEAQELMDDLVIKLRMVRFARTQSYNDLFSGDPTWVTESIGGMSVDGKSLVTKNSFRTLNTLYNLGPSPEPNLTVLWSNNLPEGFK